MFFGCRILLFMLRFLQAFKLLFEEDVNLTPKMKSFIRISKFKCALMGIYQNMSTSEVKILVHRQIFRTRGFFEGDRGGQGNLYISQCFLSAIWLPHGQFWPSFSRQPHSSDVNHCVLSIDDPIASKAVQLGLTKPTQISLKLEKT